MRLIGISLPLIFIFAHLTLTSMHVSAPGTGNFPPPQQEDWVITNETRIWNDEIEINGNLTIEDGGKLIIDNTILHMNVSSYGSGKILVKEDGEFHVLNNSRITEGWTEINYDMELEDGSIGIFKDSTIESCGWNDYAVGMSTSGILIWSDDVLIDNCTIRNNYSGIIVINATIPITNSTIRENVKQGMSVYNGNLTFMANNVSFNSMALLLYYSGISIKNCTISNNGDGIFAFESEIEIENTSIFSNNAFNCDDGGCSSEGSGLALDVSLSNMNVQNSNISDNDAGIIAGASTIEVSKTTFFNNSGDAIRGKYSEMIAKDNLFIDNLGYGIRWSYSPFDLDGSNVFISNTGSGRVTIEWLIKINITDSYGEPVSSAEVSLIGKGKNYSILTGLDGTHHATIAEYLITNSGEKIYYNPYNVTASKKVYWNDENYTKSTEIYVHESMELNMTIPLAKPDLRANSIEFSGSPVQHEVLQIILNITNIGNSSAQGVQILTNQILPNNLTKIINLSEVDIALGESKTVYIDWIPSHDGDVTVKVSIDPSNFFSEENEDNNILTKDVTVEEAKQEAEEDDYLWLIAGTIALIAVILIAVALALRKKQKKD